MKPVLSPKELANAIGVSESSLKRWADDGVIRVSRTAGGHRRIPIAEAIRFIRDSKSPLIRPEILGLPDADAIRNGQLDAEDDADRLFAYLREGRSAEARGLVMSMYLAGESVAAIVDGPVRRAMDQVGKLWKHDETGIYYEHRATDICIQAVQQLRLTLQSEDKGPIALGGAPSGDPYLLPSLAAATVLAAEGFRAINLGPETPVEVLLHAAERNMPELVWVSVSAIADPNRLRQSLVHLAESLESRQTKLVVGGRLCEELRLPRVQNLFVGAAMTELAAFGKGVLAQRHRLEQEQTPAG